MKSPNLKYRDLIFVMIYEYKFISKLFDGNKKYEHLLQKLGNYKNEGDPLPLQKDLLKVLDISRPELLKLMQDLYEDFQRKICNKNAYPVSETEIWLLAKSFEDYWVIGVDKLEIIPRKGEDFTIPFIRNPIYSTPSFIVEEVSHEMENGIHRVHIHLKDKLEVSKKLSDY